VLQFGDQACAGVLADSLADDQDRGCGTNTSRGGGSSVSGRHS
jgi:hypothetical protein